MDASIKGLIGKFLDEVKELESKSANKESLKELGKTIDEFEATSKAVSIDMRLIYGHLHSRVNYDFSVQHLNEIIDGKTIPNLSVISEGY